MARQLLTKLIFSKVPCSSFLNYKSVRIPWCQQAWTLRRVWLKRYSKYGLENPTVSLENSIKRAPYRISKIAALNVHEFKDNEYQQTKVNTEQKQDLSLNSVSIIKFKPLPRATYITIVKGYKELAKAKLAALVILTTMCGYALAPGATSLTCLMSTTVGTGLCIASANAFNQWIEAPYDAQMSRTRNRVLVRRAITPFHAFSFGSVAGILGVLILSIMANPMTALMGSTNILLYTCVYTPMKRASILNTWAGSLVGAIPPMMGWVACTNSFDVGAWILGGILYAWQFPHFNSLSWNLRADYSKAGYRMMAVTNPSLNARVSLRYSLLLFPLCYLTPYVGMTSWWFAWDSSLMNCVLLWGAFKFWRDPNEKTARDCFFASLIHLPVIFALMMVHKNFQQSNIILDHNPDISESDETGILSKGFIEF
ncbi:hypothetical protein G9A89_011761 [Geosiphon pyriformis]|nr:hypothetical protein G9A89_011761 [Geosiphon pyriformis]